MYRISYENHHPHKVIQRVAPEVHPTLAHAHQVLDQVVRNWPTAPNPPVRVVRNGGGRIAAQFRDGVVMVIQVQRAGR